MTRRSILHIGIGDTVELIGLAGACYAVAILAAVGWAILLGSLVLIVKANLELNGVQVSVPLPSPRRDARALRRAVRKRAVQGRAAVRWAIASRRLRYREARIERRGVRSATPDRPSRPNGKRQLREGATGPRANPSQTPPGAPGNPQQSANPLNPRAPREAKAFDDVR